jgi:hypothetical protein
VKEYVNECLKMIDVCAYIKSLKLSWLRRIVSSECDGCCTFVDIIHIFIKTWYD